MGFDEIMLHYTDKSSMVIIIFTRDKMLSAERKIGSKPWKISSNKLTKIEKAAQA
jgi:hypothetical protein